MPAQTLAWAAPTRYEKLAQNYLSGLTLAALLTWLP